MTEDSASLAAEKAGYLVAVDDPEKGTHTVLFGATVISTGHTYADADNKRIRLWQRDRELAEHRRQLAQLSSSRREERDRLITKLQSAVDEVNNAYPDADDIDVHDGSPWLWGRRFRNLTAAEAEIILRSRHLQREDQHRQALADAITTAGLEVGPTREHGLANNRHGVDWWDHNVDVRVPLHHPEVPTRGRIELVDGMYLIETVTRAELAESLAVPVPETLDERFERRRALEDARQAAIRRADAAAAQAHRASEEAASIAGRATADH